MKNEYKIGLLVLTLLVGFYFGILSVKVGPVELGGGQEGTQTNIASSSEVSLTSSAVTGIAGTSTCVARTITTGVNGVGLAFMDKPLAGLVGDWQAASTTVTYPAETFGCGGIRARANGATNLRITEYTDSR